ncbi:glycosyltransferase family 87 protein [Celeribacter litoreus]|uniref:glycosyltransferase family 87 protein n=1 Tax=Celeribacter litoreus TaxID=2876714 RepID=UPI001CCD8F8B|nr:glycosyltransferase family 87 protein [Celeribacter litoreus]
MALGAVAFMAWAFNTFWGGWAPDLSALYIAGHAYDIGAPDLVYQPASDPRDNSTPIAWKQLLQELGEADQVAYPYLYPPMLAKIAAPLTGLISPRDFFKIFLVAQVTMLASMPWLGWRLAAPKNVSPGLLFLIGYLFLFTSIASYTALVHNQLQITISFLILLTFNLYRRGFLITAGVLLALAASLKLSPAIFGILFLKDRAWKAAVAAVSSGAVFLAVSVSVAGWDMHLAWLSLLDWADHLTIISKINFSLEVLLYQSWHTLSGATSLGIGLDSPAWTAIAPKIILGLVLISVASRQKTPLPLALLTVALATALFGPLGWAHYFILPLVLLPALFLRFSNIEAGLWIIAYLITFSYSSYQHLSDFERPLTATTWVPTLVALGLLIRLVLRSFSSSESASDM